MDCHAIHRSIGHAPRDPLELSGPCAVRLSPQIELTRCSLLAAFWAAQTIQ